MVFGKRQIWQFNLLILIGILLVWTKITGYTTLYKNLLIIWGVGLFITISDLFKNKYKS